MMRGPDRLPYIAARSMNAIVNLESHKLTVFISYSRRDIAVVDQLVALLEAESIDVLIDRRDLPYGEEWQKELADFIRNADTVLWLVSQDSVGSRWVNWELGEVTRLGKRLVPVRIRDIDPEGLPESLGKIHLLPAEGLFDLARHGPLLVDVLNTDTAWLKEGTRLADRAYQWGLKGKDNGLLLRGRALKDAEDWTRAKPRFAPAVSGSVLELILNSRRATVRSQRTVTAGALAIAAVGIGLAAVSWTQRNAALANQSTYLAKLSRDQVAKGDAGTGLLLAISALPEWRFNIDRPLVPEAARSLFDAFFALHEARVLRGHTADVNTAQYSFDGRLILTASDDGSARIWDAASGQLLRKIDPHVGKVLGAQFSDDGQTFSAFAEGNVINIWNIDGSLHSTLADHTDRITAAEFDLSGHKLISASRDGTARIWSLEGPHSSIVLRGHNGPINAAKFSPDSRHALTSSADGSALVWSVEGQEEVRLTGHSGAVLGGIFDDTGTRVATFSQDRTARVWDAKAGRLLATLDHGSSVNAIAFCAKASCLVTAGRDGIAKIWDPRTGSMLFELKGHTQPITRIRTHPHGAWLLTVSRDGTAILWEIATGINLVTFAGHEGDVFDASFSRNGEFAVTASRDRTARTWRLPAPTTTERRANLAGPLRSIDVSQDARVAALGSVDGSIYLMTLDRMIELERAKVGDSAVTLLAFSHSGDRLLVGLADGTVSLRSVPTLTLLYSSAVPGSEIVSGAFQTNASEFLVARADGTQAAFNGRGLQPRGQFRPSGRTAIAATAFSPTSDRSLVGELNGTAYIVDSASGRQLVGLKGHSGAILQGEFDPSGRMVVTSSEDGTARVWDADTGKQVQILSGHEAPVTFADFSTDSKLIATASADRTIRIWRLGLTSPLAIYQGHLAGVDLVRFTQDRKSLVSVSSDGDVHVWRFEDSPSAMLKSAKAVTPRCLSPRQLEDFGLAGASLAWCSDASRALP
jgi:WD40 repeat protein